MITDEQYEHLVDPQAHPDKFCVVSLHDGDTFAEFAESIACWFVETKEELRTVLDVLDDLIQEEYEDAMTTVLLVPKKKVLDLGEIQKQASDAIEGFGE
jgi:hypothetical protein